MNNNDEYQSNQTVTNEEIIKSEKDCKNGEMNFIFRTLKNKRNIVIFAIIFAVLIVAGVMYNNSQNEKEYAKQLNQLQYDLLSVGADSEKLSNQIVRAWSEVISGNLTVDRLSTILNIKSYEYKSLSKTYDKYYKGDFDKVITDISNFNQISGYSPKIKKTMADIELRMSEMKKVPAKYKEQYDLLIKMYTETKRISELAVNPTGSLLTYKNDTKQSSDNFMKYYDEYKLKKPDVK